MITYTRSMRAAYGVPFVLESDDDGAGNPGAPTWRPWDLPVEGEPTTTAGQTVEEKDEWPAGWLDLMFGCLSDMGLERPPQGDFEERDRVD